MTLFQLVTLPVEYDASRRAKEQLFRLGLVHEHERAGVKAGRGRLCGRAGVHILTLFIRREAERYDGDTAITLYLREIGQVKLLTPQGGNRTRRRHQERRQKSARTHDQGQPAPRRKIARDYEGIGLPLLDLISEGNIGLMKAVERFDPKKGGKLSTYGSWWIKQSIKRALANQSKTIRLPVHLVDKISKMRRTAMKLQEELGREPTDEELADELGMTAARVARCGWPPSARVARRAHRRRRFQQFFRRGRG
jgi:RNA polymerase sigma factor (sigma-70 family)